MLIRWLGAFRKEGDLHSSLNFELTPASDLRCAERISKGQQSKIKTASRHNLPVYRLTRAGQLEEIRP